MTDNNPDGESLLTYAGFGGAVACCAALELLGGAALVGGLATALGLSTDLTYLAVVGLGGLLAVLLVRGYQQVGGVTHG